MSAKGPPEPMAIFRTAEYNCARKVRHSSSAKAVAAASRCGSKRRIKALHVYKCDICKGWHLTSKPRPKKT